MKNYEIVRFYLVMGLNLSIPKFDDLAYQLTEFSSHIAHDPPKKLLELLLQYGIKVDYVDSKKYQTPLHIACKTSNFEFVKILVKYGAEIGPIDGDMKMPINYVEK